MIQVTAAIIKQNGKILICQRGKDDDAPLLWEFPGGKLEEAETLEQCIVREIKEELELDIRVSKIFTETDYKYEEKHIHFTFYEADIVSGTIKLNVHEAAVWAPVDTLKEYNFLPADVGVVDMFLEEQSKQYKNKKVDL